MALAAQASMELPTSLSDVWTASEQRRIDPDGVFDYMNGAGELYLAYGFQEMHVREYLGPEGVSVTAEVYRMPSGPDAFGLFTHDRTGEPVVIGQGAVYSAGLLVGWQGNWFLRLLATRETKASRDFIIDLARDIAARCGPAAALPEAIEWLPPENLDPLSVHFFHTHTCLNYHYFLATRNILNLSDKTDAVTGTYRDSSGKALALVAGYSSSGASGKAWESFVKHYLKGLKDEGPFSLCKLENGKWLAGKAAGRHVWIVLEAPDKQACLRLAERLQKRLTVTIETKSEGGKKQ